MSESTQIGVTLVRAMGDGTTRTERLTVPWERGTMVLEVLLHIYRELDPTLAFRHSCHAGRCTCCLATVNGKQVLACREPARDGMVVQPPNRFQPIRDLVADLGRKPHIPSGLPLSHRT